MSRQERGDAPQGVDCAGPGQQGTKMVHELIEKAAHLNREMSAHIAEAEILQIEALGQWQIAQTMRAAMMTSLSTETMQSGALLRRHASHDSPAATVCVAAMPAQTGGLCLCSSRHSLHVVILQARTGPIGTRMTLTRRAGFSGSYETHRHKDDLDERGEYCCA